jgi:hypothetical protein
VDSVVTLDAEELQVVPPISNQVIMDVVRSQWLLVMNNPMLAPAISFGELVVAAFTDEQFGFGKGLCAFPPSCGIVEVLAELSCHCVIPFP